MMNMIDIWMDFNVL